MCNVRRENDEMVCSTCGLRWDVADVEPPACARKALPAPEVIPASPWPWVSTVEKDVPLELSQDAARAMLKAFQLCKDQGGTPVESMQRAYRVLLDAL